MTDSRVDIPVDRDSQTVEPDPGALDTRSDSKVSPDSISVGRPQTDPTDPEPTREVQADPGPRHPATAESGTAPQAPPTPDGQDDADQVAPGLVHVGPAHADLAGEDSPIQTAPATTHAGPPQTDPVEAGQAADQAHPVAATADQTSGEPPVAAPSLRDPDEAALRLTEAAVFASATPMTPRALSQILPDDLDPAAVIAALQARYAGRGIELCEIGGGLQFRTAADLAPQLRKVVQVPRRLPRVALETLAIVAYHQPITRPEIEDLRGTGLSQQTLDVLLENDLIVARGRKETPGRPTLWGTTAKFLEYFGLRDIRELPRRQDLLLEAVRPEAAVEADPISPENVQPGPAGTLPA